MLFQYSPEKPTDAPHEINRRCYRPDLTILIAKWFAQITPEASSHITAVQVGKYGELVVKFMMPVELDGVADADGELRLITAYVDTVETLLVSERGDCWHDPYFATISMASLRRAANTI